ncbi:putative Heterokaryon incompatibility protein-domain-containing protein [Seiridium cardinale]|uniref:Heterokaryon incompatibility protein-domain-containing protein n=1 Tax=Seiridium cardinale TaxID=138064 RepID=A0ABR2XQV6_9PEZI
MAPSKGRHFPKRRYPYRPLRRPEAAMRFATNRAIVKRRPSTHYALSYAWGDENDIADIGVVVPCWLAQEDYTYAFKYIQLAVHSARSDSDVSWLQNFPELTTVDYDPESEMAPRSSKWARLYERPPGKPTGNNIWDNIALLASNHYWIRLWIVQEVCLNEKTIIFAPGSALQINLLYEFPLWLEQINKHIMLSGRTPTIICDQLYSSIFHNMYLFTSICMLQRIKEKSNTEDPLLDASVFHCSDPRDRVYDMHAFCNLELQVDYEPPVEQVYGLVAEEMVAREHPKALLDRVGSGWKGSALENPRLGSWVPGSSIQSLNQLFSYVHYRGAGKHVNRNDHWDVLSTVKDGILTVQAALADTVVDVFNWQTAGDLRACCLEIMLPVQIDSNHRVKPVLSDIIEAIGHTSPDLLGHSWGQRVIVFFPEKKLQLGLARLGIRHDENFERDVRLLLPGYKISYLDRGRRAIDWLVELSGTYAGAAAWLMGLELRWDDFAWITMERSSRLGLGPGGTTVGDEVWIMEGADFPHLLRIVGEGKEVVGKCCINGLMNGEIFEEVDSGRLKFETITII